MSDAFAAYALLLLVFAVLGTGVWAWREYVRSHGTGPVARKVGRSGSHRCPERDDLTVRGSKRWCLYCGRCPSQTMVNGVPIQCWRRRDHKDPHRYGEVSW